MRSSSRPPRRTSGSHRRSHGDSRLESLRDTASAPSGRTASQHAGRGQRAAGAPSRVDPANTTLAVFGGDGQLVSLSNERRELLCSVIGLGVKLGLIAVAGVSLMRLGSAYQQRMERQGEISAVLELENAKLAKARERFDQLFIVDGEQQLIREQSQWIAPNRLRVVWRSGPAFPSVETASAVSGSLRARP